MRIRERITSPPETAPFSWDDNRVHSTVQHKGRCERNRTQSTRSSFPGVRFYLTITSEAMRMASFLLSDFRRLTEGESMRIRAKHCLGALLLLSAAGVLSAQGGNPTGNLSGTVTDTSGAVVPKAAIQATEINTGAKLATVSGADGQFYIGNVAPGTYNVTVTVPGFKAATYSAVQVVVGQTYMLKAVMQPGDVTSSVTVEAGAQVLETTESSVGLTVTGPAITHVPTASNSALYGLALMSPDLQTIGGPRQSSADGLPGGVVNITFDGIPAQWQPGKSGDPLFPMVYPNSTMLRELSIVRRPPAPTRPAKAPSRSSWLVSAAPTGIMAGAGNFRNDYLNANYYFNNLAGLPRQKIRYDQVGYKIGGPIIKDKLFFFVDLSDWVRPQGVSRTRTILTPAASSGIYTYMPATMPSSSAILGNLQHRAGTCTANLLQMARLGRNLQVDKVVGQAFAAIQQAVTAPGVHIGAAIVLPAASLSIIRGRIPSKCRMSGSIGTPS